MKAAAKRFVLHASVAVAWCFDDEATPFTEGILNLFTRGFEALTPAVWPFEVGNALLTAERRQRLSLAQVTALLDRIAKLPITVESASPALAFGAVLSVARQQQLTEYDAAYVELALRAGLSLATLDNKLRLAGQAAGIRLTSI